MQDDFLGVNPPAAKPIPTSLSGVASAGGNFSKEMEPAVPKEQDAPEEMVADIELEPELEAIGVQKVTETIELPPDLAKMGMTAAGPAQPVTQTAVVKLPISDEMIVTGLHAQIISSFRWLSEWCVRKLKKAHLKLKVLAGGKVVRESE